MILSCLFHELKFVFHVSLWELPKLPRFAMTLLGWGFQAWQSCPDPARPGSTEPESGLGQAGMGSLQTGACLCVLPSGVPEGGVPDNPIWKLWVPAPHLCRTESGKGELHFPSPEKTGTDKIFAYQNSSGKYGQMGAFKAAPRIFSSGLANTGQLN